MSEARVIKRYANRKLYDTKSSQYVTLDQIAQMIRAGEEVRVLDNNTKDDLTSVTLAQIIFEEEKRQKSYIPLFAMRHLIQSGGASLQEFAHQAQAKVLSVFRKGDADGSRPGEGEADPAFSSEPAPSTESPTRDARPVGAMAAESAPKAVREFLERSQQMLEEWQRRADDRIRQLLEGISPFASLEKEVARLALRIEALEQQLAAAGISPSSDEN
jgi:polyhydroxyalkanoate synthesis repressor PhaR